MSNRIQPDPTTNGKMLSEYTNLDETKDKTKKKHSKSRNHSNVVHPSEPEKKSPNMNENTMPIIWLDNAVHEADENTDLKRRLEKFTKSLVAFDDEDQCYKYIGQLALSEKVIFVVSGSTGRIVIPVFHNFIQLKAIYIYTSNEHYYRKIFETYPKVKGVLTVEDDLIEKIKYEQNLYQSSEDVPLSINIYFPEERKQNVKQSDANKRFIWTYLFMQTLNQIENPLHMLLAKIEKQHLLENFDEICQYKPEKLEELKDMTNNYSSKEPVEWYTSCSNLRSWLNKAFNERDLKFLLPFRFWITDMHQQLEKYAHEQCSNKKVFTVYRSQLLESHLIMQMQTSVNAYISIDSFFLTYSNEKNAEDSADRMEISNESLQYVIFEIEIDPNLKTQPWTNISAHKPPHKQKVLFSPGTFFKIEFVGEIEQSKGSMIKYIIRLKLSSENEHGLSELISYSKRNIESETSMESLGSLIIQTDQLHQSETYFNWIIDQLTSEKQLLMFCHNNLGNIYLKAREFKNAIKSYKKAIKLLREVQYSQKWAAKCYISLADAYKFNNETEHALVNYQEALEKLKEENEAYLEISVCYNKIGNIYQEQGNSDKAFKAFKSAVEYLKPTVEQFEPADDQFKPTVEQFESAVDQFKPTVEQFESAVDQFKLTIKQFKPAVDQFKPTVEQFESAVEQFKPAVDQFKLTIEQFKPAVEKYRRTVEQKENMSFCDPLHQIYFFETRSSKHYNENNLTEAIKDLKKALNISEEYFITCDPEKARLYRNIGDLYLDSNNLIMALSSYHRAADIYYDAGSANDACYKDLQFLIKCCQARLKTGDASAKKSHQFETQNNGSAALVSNEQPNSARQSQSSPAATESEHNRHRKQSNIQQSPTSEYTVPNNNYPVATVDTSLKRSHKAENSPPGPNPNLNQKSKIDTGLTKV